ncbi:hypothetical protein AB4072_01865 [Microvirga sp. 2MCAF38]|uniref:hypothetical protein n=1 Tax=Microvirga sp. 2MCAF38 TaxID=3232989 RepID=UPI003F9943EB
MLETKHMLSSRTIWANAIGLLAIVLGILGFDTSTLDNGAVVEAVAQMVAAGSFIASTVFRIAATRQLMK